MSGKKLHIEREIFKNTIERGSIWMARSLALITVLKAMGYDASMFREMEKEECYEIVLDKKSITLPKL